MGHVKGNWPTGSAEIGFDVAASQTANESYETISTTTLTANFDKPMYIYQR